MLYLGVLNVNFNELTLFLWKSFKHSNKQPAQEMENDAKQAMAINNWSTTWHVLKKDQMDWKTWPQNEFPFCSYISLIRGKGNAKDRNKHWN